jgi:hypothetical protein
MQPLDADLEKEDLWLEKLDNEIREWWNDMESRMRRMRARM